MRMIHAIMGGDTKILEQNEELTLSKFNQKFREAENASDQESWDAKYREEYEKAKNTPEYKEALEIHQRTRICRTKSNGFPGVIVFGKRGSECVFKWKALGMPAPETIFPEDAIPKFKATKTEKSVKESDAFDAVYQDIKQNLFGSKTVELSAISPRNKAMNKVKALQKIPSDKQTADYLDMLYRVLEIDGLPDLSPINKAKTGEDIQNKISVHLLENILKTAAKIEQEPETVILSEEMV